MSFLAHRCLTTAESIAARIVDSAVWSGNTCTWRVVCPDRGMPGHGRWVVELAGPELYQGTAGIALFLTELVTFSDAPEVRQVAYGALRHAVAGAARMDAALFGLHAGRVGVAHALARYATVTGHEEARRDALMILKPLFGREPNDRALDVIGGAAGAIPVLLQLAQTLSLPAAHDSAIALGRHLVSCANRRPEGWSWGPTGVGHARDLLGYAHGTAGYAYSLLELWSVTGDDTFRYGAEQAFAYEAYHFDAASANWPDFRSYDWGELLQSPERTAAMRAALQAGGDAAGYTMCHMVAWCHGAAGIGLSRLRAFELLGDSRYAAEARTAAVTTIEALRIPATNFSLCHGLFGNFEMLLWAAERLCEPSWRAEVERRTDAAITVFEGTTPCPWPSGATAMQPDPSLLVGEAGIGHYLLRLARPEVPSILCPRAPAIGLDVGVASTRDSRGAQDNGALAQRQIDEQIYFGRTLRILERFGVEREVREHVRVLTESQSGGSTAGVLSAAIDACIAAEPDVMRATLLADAVHVDRARFAAACKLPDFVSELIDALRHIPPERVDWLGVQLRLAPCVQLVQVARDWDGWLATVGTADDADEVNVLPDECSPTYVLFRRQRAMHITRVGALCVAVLGAFTERTTAGEAVGLRVDEIAADVCGRIADIDQAAHTTLVERIHEQVRQAYAAGLLVIVRSAAPATSRDLSPPEALAGIGGMLAIL